MPDLGVNITLDPAEAAADCALAASFGFKWVRTSQEMQWGGGTDGAYALGALATFAAACTANGLKLLQCCQGMPASFARGGVGGHYGPKDQASADKWGAWFAQCALITNSTGGATSCLNEPDGFGWGTTPSVTDCAILHTAALEARDRDAPGTVFVTGEMAPGSSPEPLKFLKQIAAAAPSILTDEKVWFGWHPYVDPRYDADYNAVWNTCHRMRGLHAWKRKKKIMAGEWSVANGPPGNPRALTPEGVAAYVAFNYLPTFDRMEADGLRFGPLLWYSLRDAPAPSSWADYCGVVDVAGVAKPVAAVFSAYNA